MATRIITKSLTDLSGVGIVAGDTVIQGEGSQAITAGLDFSATSGIATWDVQEGFTGHIGGVGGPLKIGITGRFTYRAGAGTCAISAANAGGTANTAAKLINASKGGALTAVSGTFTDFESTGKRSTISESAIITNGTFIGGESIAEYNATGFTLLVIKDSTFTLRRLATTARISGNSFVRAARQDTSTSPGITATTITLSDKAKLDWRGGAITTVNVDGPDAMFIWQNAAAAYTIGTLKGDFRALQKMGVRQGANTSESGVAVTITTLTPVGGNIEDLS